MDPSELKIAYGTRIRTTRDILNINGRPTLLKGSHGTLGNLIRYQDEAGIYEFFPFSVPGIWTISDLMFAIAKEHSLPTAALSLVP